MIEQHDYLAKQVDTLRKENDELRAMRIEELIDEVRSLRAALSLHPDWKTVPRIDYATGVAWMRLPSETSGIAYTDKFYSLIRGTTHDGAQWFRCVEVDGREYECGEAHVRLAHVLREVLRRGPTICVPVEPGGILPRAKDHEVAL